MEGELEIWQGGGAGAVRLGPMEGEPLGVGELIGRSLWVEKAKKIFPSRAPTEKKQTLLVMARLSLLIVVSNLIIFVPLLFTASAISINSHCC